LNSPGVDPTKVVAAAQEMRADLDRSMVAGYLVQPIVDPRIAT